MHGWMRARPGRCTAPRAGLTRASRRGQLPGRPAAPAPLAPPSPFSSSSVLLRGGTEARAPRCPEALHRTSSSKIQNRPLAVLGTSSSAGRLAGDPGYTESPERGQAWASASHLGSRGLWPRHHDSDVLLWIHGSRSPPDSQWRSHRTTNLLVTKGLDPACLHLLDDPGQLTAPL